MQGGDGLDQFGETLRVLLEERGISQAALARRVGVSPQAVSGWINGATPSHDNVIRVEDELAVEPRGSLLKQAGYNVDDTGEAPTVESLIRSDPGLAAEDKRVLLRIIALARERHPQPQ